MKFTYPKLITIIAIASGFATLGMLPYSFYIKQLDGINTRTINGEINMPLAIASTLFLVGLLVALYLIAKYFLLIFIDDKKGKIVFIKPLMFYVKKYSFDDVIGYYYEIYRSRGKTTVRIVIKTKDEKKYLLPDFIISNFAEWETILRHHFVLFNKETNTKFSDTEKKHFLDNNMKEIIFNQAKEDLSDYKSMCLVTLFIIILDYYGNPNRRLGFYIIILVGYFFVYSIYKIIKTINFIRKNK